jgi:hypothetical protein
MIPFTKRVRAAGLILLAVLRLNASAATHTNLIYNVSISMATYRQDFFIISSNSAMRIIRNGKFSTGDIANAIASAPLYATNNLKGAKLLFRVADLGPARNPQFILRKGTNDVDVSGFFTLTFPSQYATVTSKAPAANNTTNATDYTIFDLSLSGTAAGYFDTQGFCIVKNSSVFNGRELIQREEFPATITAAVAGTGQSGFSPTLYKGTVVISGRRVEIKQD